jgi:hypothetical protein
MMIRIWGEIWRNRFTTEVAEITEQDIFRGSSAMPGTDG